MNHFRTYVWNSRPVLSVDKARWRLRWAASRQLQDYTWRRKALKSLLQLSLLSGLDSTLGEDAPMPQLPGMDMNNCLRHIAGLLGKNRVDAAFTFPSQHDRKRIYVTLFNSDCQPIGFAKIAAADGRPELLEAEAKALQEIATLSGRVYHVPELIATDTIDQCRILLSNALPWSLRPYRCRSGVTPALQISLSRTRVEPQAFEGLSWWQMLRTELTEEYSAFAKTLQRHREYGLRVGRMHGDLGPGNIVMAGSELWIYDWEQSQPDAPNSTDTIGFFLGCRTRRVLAAPQQVLGELAQRFLDGRSAADQADIVYSLAYRLAYGCDDVRHLLKHWRA